MFICCGIAKNWIEGDYNGNHYRYKKVYFTSIDEKTDGQTAGFVKIRQENPDLYVGCQFEPVYNQYGKLVRVDVLDE